MTSKLDSLKQHTQIVADTGDIDAIAKLQPTDATTNPSLLLKAASLPRCQPLLEQAIADAKGSSDPITNACDRFAVAIGREIKGIDNFLNSDDYYCNCQEYLCWRVPR